MKRDCLPFSVNVKLFFEFLVMREKDKYLWVKVFSGIGDPLASRKISKRKETKQVIPNKCK